MGRLCRTEPDGHDPDDAEREEDHRQNGQFLPVSAGEPLGNHFRQHHHKDGIDDKGHAHAAFRKIRQRGFQDFHHSEQHQGVDDKVTQTEIDIGSQEEPQADKCLDDSACQSDQDRDDEQAQDCLGPFVPEQGQIR